MGESSSTVAVAMRQDQQRGGTSGGVLDWTSFDRLRAPCRGSRFAQAKRKPAHRQPGRPVFVPCESVVRRPVNTRFEKERWPKAHSRPSCSTSSGSCPEGLFCGAGNPVAHVVSLPIAAAVLVGYVAGLSVLAPRRTLRHTWPGSPANLDHGGRADYAVAEISLVGLPRAIAIGARGRGSCQRDRAAGADADDRRPVRRGHGGVRLRVVVPMVTI